MENLNRIIILGGSAGGLEAVTELAPHLEAGLPAAVFVVLHLGTGPATSIANRLTKAGPVEAALAAEGDPIEAGRLYIAPPDHHLLIGDDTIHLSHGPRVNLARPAIDLAFRSAAVTYGARAVGVLLSGMLDDGVAGLHAIKRCGGTAIVQDPKEALYAEMPESALSAVDADHTLPASSIGGLLNQLAKTPVLSKSAIPAEIMLENEFDMNNTDDLSRMDQLGDQIPLGCPDCGGTLWEIKQGDSIHYRCHVGHSLSARTMQLRQDQEIEHALWIALRTLEEKARMQTRLAKQEKMAGRTEGANSFRSRARETHAYAERLRRLLLQLGELGPSPLKAS
jgi:two-component system chemotaxis response regulator CheB